MKPNFELEKKLYKKGFEIVIGVDEVGRGPLAGPVVAGAVSFCRVIPDLIGDPELSARSLDSRFRGNDKMGFCLSEVKDSKQLSEKQREEICKEILKCQDVVWAVGEVSEKIIDKTNILNATKLAMQKAVFNLKSKIQNPNVKSSSKSQCQNTFYVLVDGNMKFDKNWFGNGCDYKSIVKGDEKLFSIALASIIAKVYRDNLMKKYAKKYPQYGFEKHKGYGTKKHYENLSKYGACKLHRKTFLND